MEGQERNGRENRREAILHRLRRAEGQVRGLQRLLEKDRPCAEFLQQLASVQEALRAAGRIMTRNYLETCLTRAIRRRDRRIYREAEKLIFRFRP